MTIREYFTAPNQEIFDDIKANSIKIWQTYDDQFGYATEKINRIKDLENVTDNAWYMVAMFDDDNKAKLLSMVKAVTAKQIIRAMED